MLTLEKKELEKIPTPFFKNLKKRIEEKYLVDCKY